VDRPCEQLWNASDVPAMRQLTDRLADVTLVPCVSQEQTDGVTAAAGTGL
jgi:hypothetical protein